MLFFRPPGARNRPSDAPPGSVGSNGVYKTAKTPVGISPKGPPPGAADNAGGGELSKSALKNKKRKEAKKVAEKVMDQKQLLLAEDSLENELTVVARVVSYSLSFEMNFLAI